MAATHRQLEQPQAGAEAERAVRHGPVVGAAVAAQVASRIARKVDPIAQPVEGPGRGRTEPVAAGFVDPRSPAQRLADPLTECCELGRLEPRGEVAGIGGRAAERFLERRGDPGVQMGADRDGPAGQEVAQDRPAVGRGDDRPSDDTGGHDAPPLQPADQEGQRPQCPQVVPLAAERARPIERFLGVDHEMQPERRVRRPADRRDRPEDGVGGPAHGPSAGGGGGQPPSNRVRHASTIRASS